MVGHHPLLDRLARFDKTALVDLEQMAAIDPQLCFEIGWSFVTTVADVAPHVPAGFVDKCLQLMCEAKGCAHTEKAILNAWSQLSDETRGELCYSGIANPNVFSNDFCQQLFSLPSASTKDRRVIISSLATTLSDRRFPKDELARMLDTIAAAPQLNVELERFITRIRTCFL
jgi:hypothetical protein